MGRISNSGSQLTTLHSHQRIFNNRNKDTQYSAGNSDMVGLGKAWKAEFIKVPLW